MSQSRRAPKEMSRDELEEEVDELRERMQTVESDIAFLKRTLVTLTDADLDGNGHHPLEGLPESGERTRSEIEDLQSTVSHHGEQLVAVADVSQKKTEKDEKIASIAAFAVQKVDSSQSNVLVNAGEIRGCVGCCRRYAYNLIDDIGGLDDSGNGGGFDDGEFRWAAVREEKSVPTGKGSRHKKKALKIDCDSLRKSSHAPESVNKFTTTSEGESR